MEPCTTEIRVPEHTSNHKTNMTPSPAPMRTYAINHTEEARRHQFIWLYWEGLTYAQIAEEMNYASARVACNTATRLRAAGYDLPLRSRDERRASISKAQKERARQNEKALPPLTQGLKLCSRCGRLKPYDLEDPDNSEYTTQRRVLKSGITRLYPKGMCHRCDADRKRAARASDPEGHRKRRAEWLRKFSADPANREKLRRWQREAHAARLDREGRPRRAPIYGENNSRNRGMTPCNPEPFLRWLDGTTIPESFDTAYPNEARRINSIRNGVRTCTLEAVDKILRALDAPHVFVALYGDHFPPTSTDP